MDRLLHPVFRLTLPGQGGDGFIELNRQLCHEVARWYKKTASRVLTPEASPGVDGAADRGRAEAKAAGGKGCVEVRAAGGKGEQKRNWPDPAKYTTAKVWTTKDGALHISTKTDGKPDGKADFKPDAEGKPTKQMQLMRLVVNKRPRPTPVFEIIDAAYWEDKAALRDNLEDARKLIKKVTALVSAVRGKLERSGINPDVLSPLDFEATEDSGVSLRVAHMHKLDDHGLDQADRPSHLR